jgi:hypothetical protein
MGSHRTSASAGTAARVCSGPANLGGDRDRCDSIGGKGGTRTLDPGIMSADCRSQVSEFSTFGQTAVAAKCLKVHRRAGEIPANLPRARMYCRNVHPYLRSRSQTVFGPLRHEGIWLASLTGAFFLRRRFGVEGSTTDRYHVLLATVAIGRQVISTDVVLAKRPGIVQLSRNSWVCWTNRVGYWNSAPCPERG